RGENGLKSEVFVYRCFKVEDQLVYLACSEFRKLSEEERQSLIALAKSAERFIPIKKAETSTRSSLSRLPKQILKPADAYLSKEWAEIAAPAAERWSSKKERIYGTVEQTTYMQKGFDALVSIFRRPEVGISSSQVVNTIANQLLMDLQHQGDWIYLDTLEARSDSCVVQIKSGDAGSNHVNCYSKTLFGEKGTYAVTVSFSDPETPEEDVQFWLEQVKRAKLRR
ncbi:MAG: hypothetical protein KDK48_05995, partial [Chlamydiia bacterium]|nr:hypothetical protein [Chlamydiia bacterium]